MARHRHKPKPLSTAVGSRAFGAELPSGPVGAASVGAPDSAAPLRGALLFGNDPRGNPLGSESFGGSEETVPLKGALLVGNDPRGNPTGADAFGGAEGETPLKGALLFGNDPKGDPRGSDAFGMGDTQFQHRGAAAVGAPQLFVERLHKDEIGYDFGGVLLHLDESSLAGIRKDPNDRLRQRLVGVLHRALGMQVEKLRQGLDEHAIPWGRLRRERELDHALARELREAYRLAPGEILGIGHVRDLLEETERMHSFVIEGDWDTSPIQLRVLWDEQAVAYGVTTFHKEHTFFTYQDVEGEVLAYVDTLEPHRRKQQARIRAVDGGLVGLLTLDTPDPKQQPEGGAPQILRAMLQDTRGRDVLRVEEERCGAQFFRARLVDVASGVEVGLIEDRLRRGKIQTRVELDVAVPRVMGWALATLIADLARRRRRGWPEKTPESEADRLPTIEEALGPRRPRRGPA